MALAGMGSAAAGAHSRDVIPHFASLVMQTDLPSIAIATLLALTLLLSLLITRAQKKRMEVWNREINVWQASSPHQELAYSWFLTSSHSDIHGDSLHALHRSCQTSHGSSLRSLRNRTGDEAKGQRYHSSSPPVPLTHEL